MTSERTGLPTISAPGSAPGNPTSTLRAIRASQRLAVPAIAFCSCTSNGIPAIRAMTPPGKATYPPMPNTTSGWVLRRAARAWQHARARRNGNANKAPRPLPRSPEKRKGSMGMPRAATKRPSIFSGWPNQTTRQPRSCICSATARPGMI